MVCKTYIGQFLSSAGNEINQLEKKQKRSLMQKLLTGEVRVKVNDKNGQAADDS